MGRGGGIDTDLPTRPVPYPRFDGTQRCRDTDPEVFFPRTSRESYFWPQITRPMCAECPFLQPCREYAISYDVDGFWGGLSKKERREERARLGIAPIMLTLTDSRLMRQRLAELDDGVSTAREIAARVGCAVETVQRIRRERREVA